MNRAALIALAFTLVGCNGLKRLTGGDDHKDPAHVEGYWSADVTAGGATAQNTLLVTRDDRSIHGLASSYGVAPSLSGPFTGSVGEDSIEFTIDEGSRCVEKIHVSGEARGDALVVRITGKGNNIPGTTCYPDPIDVTAVYRR